MSPSLGQHDAARGQLDRPAVLTDDPSQSRVRRNSGQRDVPFAVAGTGANGDASLWFHRHHSGQPREGEPGDTRPWLHEIDRDVLALRDPELRLDETLDGIGEDQPDHQDGNGEADPEDRRCGPQRVARDVTQHHAPGSAQTTGDPGGLQDRPPVARRRFRSHRFCGRNPHGAVTAEKAPAVAAPSVRPAALRMTDSGTAKCSSGNRKNWL